MNNNQKITKHLKEAQKQLNLLLEWYKKDLKNNICEDIICSLDHIMDDLYRAQTICIDINNELEQEENNEEESNKNI